MNNLIKVWGISQQNCIRYLVLIDSNSQSAYMIGFRGELRFAHLEGFSKQKKDYECLFYYKSHPLIHQNSGCNFSHGSLNIHKNVMDSKNVFYCRPKISFLPVSKIKTNKHQKIFFYYDILKLEIKFSVCVYSLPTSCNPLIINQGIFYVLYYFIYYLVNSPSFNILTNCLKWRLLGQSSLLIANEFVLRQPS